MTIEFPEKLQILFEPYRYKILYGGRGGAKSWGIARALLIKGAEKPLRILCAREVQKSIKQSVHTLLSDQIEALGLSSFYEILATEIRGKNGTNFSFAGLVSHTVESVKSFEGCDIVWVEEAKNVSDYSWKILIPTIRKDGSEIWVSFNPELEEDPTYQRFVMDPPTGAVVLKLNWDDNPWFPEVLRQEMEDLKRKNHTEYLNVWEGQCKQSVDGAVFANELRKAAEEQRITRVPYKVGVPVHTFWDLGQSDNTAIWFVQIVGMEFRLIDYYQNNGHKMPHYIEQLLARSNKYDLDEHCLPHDAEHEQLAAHSSIKQQLQDAIRDNPRLGKLVRIVPRVPKKALAIEAARLIFDQCLFDKENTSDGLQCLRHLSFANDPETGKVSKEPKHDKWSHGCLTADSLVLTKRGHIPIINVLIGDDVWTPRGYAKVLNSGATKFTSDIIRFQMSDGSELKCTPEHKILTQKGFVYADALLYSDRIFSGNEWQCALISLISMVVGTGFRETITGKTSGPTLGQATCIGQYGNSITALFKRAMRSTIKTAMFLTTLSKTLSQYMALSTSGSIRLSDMSEASCIHLASLPGKKPLNGTDQSREGDGTSSTGLRRGKIGSGINAIVTSAVKNLCRLILLAPNGAPSVVEVTRNAGKMESQLVYDLTVESHACYQANGLLVSNCDAFMGFAQHYKRPQIGKAKSIMMMQRR